MGPHEYIPASALAGRDPASNHLNPRYISMRHHFEYIADTVAKGIMNVGIQTSTPIIFGVLTCLNEEQVKKRSSGNSNHGYDWGKTAVEMACLKQDATGKGASAGKLGSMGFSTPSEADADKASEKKTKVPGFF